MKNSGFSFSRHCPLTLPVLTLDNVALTYNKVYAKNTRFNFFRHCPLPLYDLTIDRVALMDSDLQINRILIKLTNIGSSL